MLLSRAFGFAKEAGLTAIGYLDRGAKRRALAKRLLAAYPAGHPKSMRATDVALSATGRGIKDNGRALDIASKQIKSVLRGPEKTAAPIWKSLLHGAGNAAQAIAKKPAVWKGGLAIGGGAVAGAYLHKQLQKQDPITPGALTREKRRVEMDRYGTL